MVEKLWSRWKVGTRPKKTRQRVRMELQRRLKEKLVRKLELEENWGVMEMRVEEATEASMAWRSRCFTKEKIITKDGWHVCCSWRRDGHREVRNHFLMFISATVITAVVIVFIANAIIIIVANSPHFRSSE